MKKKLALAVLILCAIIVTGCLKYDHLENAKIYTTVYPITYLTERIYGDHAQINSIYPDGANTNDYILTEKQIKTYSKSDILIYNGLSDEKQISKEFLNENKNLKIIDVANGINYTSNIEDLWLSPNNYLMLANNIKNSLITLVDNKYTEESINKNYNSLEEELSLMDASLRSIAKKAIENHKDTLIVSNNKFKYLENYGFTIISLEDATNNNTLETFKNNIRNKKYTSLFAFNSELENEYIASLNKEGLVITLNPMYTLSTSDRENNENYMTIMKQFNDNIKNYVLN